MALRLFTVWMWVALKWLARRSFDDRRDLILCGRVLKHDSPSELLRGALLCASADQCLTGRSEDISSLVSNHDSFAVELGQ
jgi:hypothetical protein